jgi:hypothetical protein
VGTLYDYESKIRDSKNNSRDALHHVRNHGFPGQPFMFDYDIDTRWATVTAFTTILINGRRYRLSIEEEVD